MIPSASHPNWRKLITGELNVQPEFLATKFLLQHLNSVYRSSKSPKELDVAVQELVAMFSKNVSLPKVQSDIKRIFG